uniref:Uncharacterized protein n=1 Tax=Hemiselmis tepida TaxID=464990 RepID=A0A7S0Z036_9CRYP|mmetsp:Transcript_25946/g.66015  ORF Transcript_25946/g.66015 Transcript_25946/m.66015 type:complete len:258 (+) Transcript_25946:79-852(+)
MTARRVLDGRSPYAGDPDDEEDPEEVVIVEEAGTQKPLSERVAHWGGETISKAETGAKIAAPILAAGGRRVVGAAEDLGTAAAGRFGLLIGKLPPRRKRGAEGDPEAEKPEDSVRDDYDDCGRAIETDPELVEPEAEGGSLDAVVGEHVSRILDGVEAGVQRVEGPARAVEQKVGQCIVDPVSKTLDTANVSGRMEALAEGIGKTVRPLGCVVGRIERALVGFVDGKVSPHLGSVMGPAAIHPRRPRTPSRSHSHEH